MCNGVDEDFGPSEIILKKKKVKPRKKRSPPKEVVQLLEKVKGQLEALKKPVGWKRANPQIDWCGDVLYYKKLDPFWLSTMTGQFAGRVVGKKKRRNLLEVVMEWFGEQNSTRKVRHASR